MAQDIRYQRANVQAPQLSVGGGAQALGQATSNAFESLSQRLDSFSAQQYEKAGFQAKQEAINKATYDVIGRKEKIDKIRSEIQDPTSQQDEINKVLEGQRKEDDTIYGRAYNTAFSASYADQITVDAQSAADLAYIEAKGDPNAFAKMYGKFEQQTTTEAPTPELAITAKRAFLKYGAETYRTIAMEQYKKQEAQNKAAFESKTKLMEDRYILAVKNGDVSEQASIVSEYKASATNAIRQGWTNESEVEYFANTIHKKAYTEKSLDDFRKSNNRVGVLKEIRSNSTLSSDETEKLVGQMHKIMQNEVDDYKIVNSKEKEQHDMFVDSVKKSNYRNLVGGTLSKSDLDRQLSLNLISVSEYDDLIERTKTQGAGKTDSEEYLNVFSNIDMYTDKDIIKNNKISMADKQKLLNEKEARDKMSDSQAKELGKWDATVNGKQAVRELKNEFGILENTFMAQLDMNKETSRDYVTLQRMMFDEIEALPIEQRHQMSLQISRRLIKEYNDGTLIGTKTYKERLNKEQKAKEEADKPKKDDDIKGKSNFLKYLGITL